MQRHRHAFQRFLQLHVLGRRVGGNQILLIVMQGLGHIVDQIIAQIFAANQQVRHSHGVDVFRLSHVSSFGNRDFIIPGHGLLQFGDHIRLQRQDTNLQRRRGIQNRRCRQPAGDQDSVYPTIFQRFRSLGITKIFAFHVFLLFVIQPVQTEDFFGIDFGRAANGARHEFLSFKILDRLDVGIRRNDDMHDVRIQVRNAAQKFGRLILKHFSAIEGVIGDAVLGKGDFRFLFLHQQHILRSTGRGARRSLDAGDLLVEKLRHGVAERVINTTGRGSGNIDVLNFRRRRFFIAAPAAAACDHHGQSYQENHCNQPLFSFHAQTPSNC